MNLPHQAPLIFAKEILSINGNNSSVLCDFERIPTLAMFIEAAAQASISFNEQSSEPKVGFLTKVNNVIKHENIKNTSYIFNISQTTNLGNIKEYEFESFGIETDIKVVSGSLIVYVTD